MTITAEIPVECPTCHLAFDHEINIHLAGSRDTVTLFPGKDWKDQVKESDGFTKAKCPHCNSLVGIDAELDVDVWDRSADSEG